MAKILFQREGRSVKAREGETLLTVMQREGIAVAAPCGGHGKCGKCKVYVEGQEALACRTVITQDLHVETVGETEQAKILTEGSGQAGRFSPVLRVTQVVVPPCRIGESASDWTRFVKALKEAKAQANDAWEGNPLTDAQVRAPRQGAAASDGAAARRNRAAKACAISPDPAIASKIGPLTKENGGTIYAVTCAGEVLEVAGKKPKAYMAAVDIGTTTVVAYLLDAEDGTQKQVASCLNPQGRFGADVISRAEYTLTEGDAGLSRMSTLIQEAVAGLIAEMAEKEGIFRENIYAISIAGNTCMHHLFLGMNVDSLVHAPYNPVIEEEMILNARDYGIRLHPRAKLFLLPNIAGFVGADTVGCLVATKLAEEHDWTLLVDIGTNGEMVLGREHRMAACSTAAGPALEGAGIGCGMRGSAGAISEVSIESGQILTKVIGGGRARGICGSGLIDALSALRRADLMDESGVLAQGDFLLAEEAKSETGKQVVLTQRDVRQVQMAKAAIATGVRLLAKRQGIDVADIRKVLLAGAFGSFLSPEHACDIGLLPPELRGRIQAVGNAAGEGAKRVLLDRAEWVYAGCVAREVEFVELAADPDFQDTFVDELEFPELSH